MLHAKYRHKDTLEDPKTSAVFENLMLLPDEIVWQILRRACAGGENLPKQVGSLVHYSFWPHWDKSGTHNKLFVEPDVFFRFQELDVLIEAKLGDGKGQYRDQWEREITAYLNEYGHECKAAVLIAVGGTETADATVLPVRGRNFSVVTCSWMSLLIQVGKFYEQEEWRSKGFISYDGSIKRILENIIMAFNVHGVNYVHWLDELTLNGKNMEDKMIDVRSAFRQLYQYQRSVIGIVNYIREHTSFTRMYGRKRFSQPIHNVQGSPMKSYANLNVFGGMWAWDFLYGYVFEYNFGKREIDGKKICMSVIQVSDDGSYCSQSPHPSRTQLSTYESIESSHSYLVFVVGTILWPKTNNNIDSEQLLKDFIRGEKDETILKNEKGDLSVIKRYPMERFINQAETDKVMTDFGSRVKELFEIKLFIK